MAGASGVITLSITGGTTPSGTVPLFVTGGGELSENITELFIGGGTNGFQQEITNLPLFLSEVSPFNTLPLIIGPAIKRVAKTMPLFLTGGDSPTSLNANIPLFIQVTDTDVPTGNITLVITGESSVASSVPLYVHQDTQTHNVPLFIRGASLSLPPNLGPYDNDGYFVVANSLDLYINRINIGEVIPLCLIGGPLTTKNKNIPAYLYGVLGTPTQNIPLVLSNVSQDLQNYISLYLRGGV